MELLKGASRRLFHGVELRFPLLGGLGDLAQPFSCCAGCAAWRGEAALVFSSNYLIFWQLRTLPGPGFGR